MISLNFANFLYLKCIFGGAYGAWLRRHFPQKGGWDASVSRSYSIQPNIRILIENAMTVKAGQNFFAKSESSKFTSVKKYTQLLFIKRTWQSQKFDKPFLVLITYFSLFLMLQITKNEQYNTIYKRVSFSTKLLFRYIQFLQKGMFFLQYKVTSQTSS